MTGISRRELLRGAGWLGAGVGLAACSASTSDSAAPTRSLDTADPLPSPSAGPALSEVPLPKTHPWVPHPAEVSAHVKVLGARLVEAACAWPSGDSGSGAARQRLGRLGFDPDLVEPLKQLLGVGKAAAVQVVMAQYGGILSGSASVLLVVDQWVLDADDRVVAGGTTLDVRLISTKPRWRVTEIRPARLEPAAKGSPALRAPCSGTTARDFRMPQQPMCAPVVSATQSWLPSTRFPQMSHLTSAFFVPVTRFRCLAPIGGATTPTGWPSTSGRSTADRSSNHKDKTRSPTSCARLR